MQFLTTILVALGGAGLAACLGAYTSLAWGWVVILSVIGVCGAYQAIHYNKAEFYIILAKSIVILNEKIGVSMAYALILPIITIFDMYVFIAYEINTWGVPVTLGAFQFASYLLIGFQLKIPWVTFILRKLYKLFTRYYAAKIKNSSVAQEANKNQN